MVTPSAVQTKPLVRSIHNNVAKTEAIRISRPPMVGVPCLVIRWLSGPSSRIGWPPFCRAFNSSIKTGPIMKLMTNAVMTAPPVRKVR